MVEPVSKDLVFRGKLSRWTRTMYIKFRIYDPREPLATNSKTAISLVLENHFLTMLEHLENLTSLYLSLGCHRTTRLTRGIVQSAWHSLTHLTTILRTSQSTTFDALGLLVHLRELFVTCQSFDDRALSEEEEDLRVIKPWNYPHLQTLGWSHIHVSRHDHNAFLEFLARQRFPALWDLGLRFKKELDEDIRPLKNFLECHPTITSLIVWDGATETDFLMHILPHVHARRFRIGTPLQAEARFLSILPVGIRELVLSIDFYENSLLEAFVFEELENKQNHLVLERVVIVVDESPSGESFEWSNLAASEYAYEIRVLGIYMAHAFRLRKRGIMLVDETDVSILAEPILKVSFSQYGISHGLPILRLQTSTSRRSPWRMMTEGDGPWDWIQQLRT
jgi:hypothetical protein